jgi:hypothetical protein
MQALYPENLLFTSQDIKNGGSILFLIGKFNFNYNPITV